MTSSGAPLDLVENWEATGGNPYDNVDPEGYLADRFVAGAKYNGGGIHALLPKFMKGILPEKLRTVMEIGAGPTVYLPTVMRHIAESLYTSDYAEANRQALEKFVTKSHSFDWNLVCREIADAEGSSETTEEMLEGARKIIKGVLFADVYDPAVIRKVDWVKEGEVVPKKFQLVTSIHCHFTICATLEGFNQSIKNSVSLVEEGGYFLLAGIPNLTTFEIRGEDKFCSYPLTTDEVINALKEAGLCTTEGEGFKIVEYPRTETLKFLVAIAKKL